MTRTPPASGLPRSIVTVMIALASGIAGMILARFGGWLVLRCLIAAFSPSARPTAWAAVERMVTMWREYGWSLASGAAVGTVLALTLSLPSRVRAALAIGVGALWAYSPAVVKALGGHYRIDGFDLLDLGFVILGACLALRIERLWRLRLHETSRTPARATR